MDALAQTGHDGENAGNLFGAIDTLRIPVTYLAELFTAGDPAPVEAALRRLAAMRTHMRAVNLGEEPDPATAAEAGLDVVALERMYRLLSLAKYDERYVIPTAYVTADHASGPAAGQGCSLDGPGGPGMLAEGFHSPPATRAERLRGRVNLLNWDGKGLPDGLFPPRPGEGR